MNRFLTRGLLPVALVLSACDRASTPRASGTVPVDRMTGTVSMSAAGPADAASDLLTGRTLTLDVGARGWDNGQGGLGYTAHYGFDVSPVASTVIDAAYKYSISLPRQVPASSLTPATGIWTTDPFTAGTCAPAVKQFSDPAMNLGMATLRVLPGGPLTRQIDVGFPLEWRSRAPVADLVMQGLVYADRAGSVNVQYDCVSQFNFRKKSDTQLSLQAGWNVLILHSVERGGTEATGAFYAYEMRSRPLSATGEA